MTFKSALYGRVAAMLGAATVPVATALAEHVPAAAPLTNAHGPRLVIPIMNPIRGRTLFVFKGCIACHAINGVGGHDAPNMDAHTMNGLINPFDFAAKMWNHAPGMIAAQEGAFGGQVYFTGDDLVNSDDLFAILSAAQFNAGPYTTATPPPALATVPEPSRFILAALGVLALLPFAWQRHGATVV